MHSILKVTDSNESILTIQLLRNFQHPGNAVML